MLEFDNIFMSRDEFLEYVKDHRDEAKNLEEIFSYYFGEDISVAFSLNPLRIVAADSSEQNLIIRLRDLERGIRVFIRRIVASNIVKTSPDCEDDICDGNYGLAC